MLMLRGGCSGCPTYQTIKRCCQQVCSKGPEPYGALRSSFLQQLFARLAVFVTIQASDVAILRKVLVKPRLPERKDVPIEIGYKHLK